MSHLNLSSTVFSTNFYPIKIDMSGNTVWQQAVLFKNSPKLTIFGIFNELLSTTFELRLYFAWKEFQFWYFQPSFVPILIKTYLVTLFDRKIQVFKTDDF